MYSLSSKLYNYILLIINGMLAKLAVRVFYSSGRYTRDVSYTINFMKFYR